MNLEKALEQLQEQQGRLAANPRTTPGDWANLEASYIGLLNQFPDDAKISFLLGTLYISAQKAGIGVALLERARKLGALGPATWLNQAVAYKTEHHDKQAAECYKKALEEARREPHLDEDGVNGDESHALHGLASLHVNAGSPHQCIYWAEKALKVNPNDRFAKWNKGLAHLELGQFEDGFKLYDEAGFIESHMKAMERKLKTYGGLPRWDGTPGQTVITYGEQGVGDEIMFLSMLPDLMKDCKVIVDCDKRIEQMIRRSFPGLEGVYPTSDIDADFAWIANHKIDAFVPMGSLGKHYRKRGNDFPKTPYLKADPEKVAKWRDILAGYDGLKVGISWAGGLKKTRYDKRTIPLGQWGPILNVPGVNFFSLQYHDQAADAAARAGNEFGVPVHHWRDMIADYEETAGFLANLDLVITVNTSLHHLCGALGIEQWCLTPKYCAWRYGVQGASPWYGNCTMLRQANDGEWSQIIRQVAEMLSDRANVRAAA